MERERKPPWTAESTPPERPELPPAVIEFALVVTVGVLVACVARLVVCNRQLASIQFMLRARDRERTTVFNFLNSIGERITQGVELDATLSMVVEFCMSATKADAGAIFVVDPQDPKWLQARVVQGLFPPLHEVSSDKLISKRKYLADYVKKERLQVGEGIIGLVAEKGEAVLIPDAEHDRRVPRSARELVPLEGLILAPLVVRGDVKGVLVLINKRVEGQTFNEADRGLVTALADQAAVTLDIVRLYEEFTRKQRLEQELLIARDFQSLLLPREVPDLKQLEIAGYSQSAQEVGGDYYDYIDVDDDHLGVVIADVAGKGIPGALVMASLRSTLRAEAHGDLSPKSVLGRVNRHLTRDTRESIFISVTYGIVDLRNGKFRFARAGHEPLVCVSPEDSRVRLHTPAGMVVGMVDDEHFSILEEEEVDLGTAGIVVLNTDGVSEAMDAEREEYGQERMHSVLLRSAGKSPEQVVEALVQDIGEFTRGLPQHDDITLVVMRWRTEHTASAELK